METAAIRNKGYFDQNNAVLIPNVIQFMQKAYIITNKAQKFQILDDLQNFVKLVVSLKRTSFSQKAIFCKYQQSKWYKSSS